MTGAATPRKPHADRVADILSAARAVFSERGYDGASMAEIAARAGIVEATIYKHFTGKRALLFEVIRAVYEPLIARLEAEVDGIAGARNQLRYLVWAQLVELSRDEALSRVVVRELRPRDGDAHREPLVALQRRVARLIARIVDGGVCRGELRPDVPRRMVRDVVLGAVEHLVWQAIAGPEPVDPEAAADELVDLLVRGAGRPADAEPAERIERAVARLEAVVAALANRPAGARSDGDGAACDANAGARSDGDRAARDRRDPTDPQRPTRDDRR